MSIFKNIKNWFTKKRTKKERSKKITFYMIVKGEEDQIVTVVPSKEDYLQAIDIIAHKLYDRDYYAYCRHSNLDHDDDQVWLDYIRRKIKSNGAEELDEYSVVEVKLTTSELCSLLRTFTFSEPLELECENIEMEHLAFDLLESLFEKIAEDQDKKNNKDENDDNKEEGGHNDA